LGQEVFTDRLVLLINNKSNGRSKDQLWTAAAELSAANLPQTHAEEDKGYSVQVVESLGCISQGKTIKQAIANIKDAIPGYLEAFPDELVEPI
jgi:predicted RNase H-like HicB family nuclease